MASNSIFRTPSFVLRTKTCSIRSLGLLPRRPIATQHHATILPSKQPQRSIGPFLAGFAIATSLSTVLWLCFRTSQDQTVHKTAQDPSKVDEALEEIHGDYAEGLKALVDLAGFGPNSPLRMLHGNLQPRMVIMSQTEKIGLQTELHRLERIGLPTDQPCLLGLLWQIPSTGMGNHDEIVPYLTAMMKRFDENGEFVVPGYAVALTQWNSYQILWEYKDGCLKEVRRFSNLVAKVGGEYWMVEETDCRNTNLGSVLAEPLGL